MPLKFRKFPFVITNEKSVAAQLEYLDDLVQGQSRVSSGETISDNKQATKKRKPRRSRRGGGSSEGRGEMDPASNHVTNI